MAATVTASLDVMGGDKGAEVVLPGAEIALSRHPDLRFRLYGDEAIVRPMLDAPSRRSKRVSTFEHCEISVKMDDKPSQALRRGRWRSSMWRSIEAVKSGAADYAVSAGNTGALMAMAKFCLRGSVRDRPAGDRRHLADAEGREHSPRLRRDDRRRRRGAVRVRRDGRGDGARASRQGAADRRPSQHRRRGGQGAGGNPHRRADAEGSRICRTSSTSASSRATTSARATPTWSSPRASPATSR